MSRKVEQLMLRDEARSHGQMSLPYVSWSCGQQATSSPPKLARERLPVLSAIIYRDSTDVSLHIVDERKDLKASIHANGHLRSRVFACQQRTVGCFLKRGFAKSDHFDSGSRFYAALLPTTAVIANHHFRNHFLRDLIRFPREATKYRLGLFRCLNHGNLFAQIISLPSRSCTCGVVFRLDL
jgi:hypothetical protein